MIFWRTWSLINTPAKFHNPVPFCTKPELIDEKVVILPHLPYSLGISMLTLLYNLWALTLLLDVCWYTFLQQGLVRWLERYGVLRVAMWKDIYRLGFTIEMVLDQHWTYEAPSRPIFQLFFLYISVLFSWGCDLHLYTSLHTNESLDAMSDRADPLKGILAVLWPSHAVTTKIQALCVRLCREISSCT